MAEDIVIGIEVDPSGKGAKTLKSLKDEFRVLQKELENTRVGTKEYQQAIERLGAVKDEIGDLRDTISALNPEGKVQAFTNVAGKLAGGFQAATGAAALFGAQSEELEKQLLKVQAATALAQGIQSVVGLKDAFAVLGAVIAANPLMALGAVIIGITTAVVAFNSENEKTVKTINDLNDAIARENAELDALKGNYNDHAALMAAKGEDEIAIQKIKIEGIKAEREELKTLEKQYADLYRVTSGEEREKALKNEEDTNAKRIALKQQLVIEIAKLEAMIYNEEKKLSDEASKAAIKAAEERAREQIRIHKQFVKERAEAEFLAEASEWETVILPQKQKEAQAEIDLQLKVDNAKADSQKKLAESEQALKDKQKLAADKKAADDIKMEQAYFSAVADLSAVYFNGQLANAKGNAEKENKIRKKQFEVDKALRATQATIDTLRGVAAAAPNIPLQIAVGVSGAALVAKILTTQYNQPSTNFSSDINSSAPQIQTQAPVITTSTRLNEQGQNISQRVYLVETDVTESQGRVARLQEQSSF